MRPYTHSTDIGLMLDLLRAGERLAYYGVGDLAWRLAYDLRDVALEDHIQVSEQGWILLTPRHSSFDVYALPGADPAPWIAEAEARIRPLLPTASSIRTHHVIESEIVLIAALEAAGFSRNQDVGIVMACDLPATSQPTALPAGFFPRTMRDTADALLWGTACADAFSFTERLRYELVMASPLYDPKLDVVVVDPQGQVAVFASGWLDPVTRAGQIEPVGTRTAHQRRGLGKMALWGALKRLSDRGARSAMLHTRQSNSRAIQLYEAVGFREVMKVYRYEKAGLL